MLAGEYLESVDIVKISRPVIRQVTAATGESAALGVKNGWEIVNLCKEDSPQLVKPTLQIGERSPLYASACGKAILAHMSENEIEEYLTSVALKSITPKTITNPKVLRAQLRRIRAKGVAYNREEISEQIIAVAAPVFDLYGSVNAAIVVSFPITRNSPKKEKSLEKIISEASRAVSEQLGFKGHFNRKPSKGKKDFKTKKQRLPTFGLF
jgi:IclR family acetate operon transcriptional repressor